MIAHPDDARKYGELKEKLAEQFPDDIEAYCDGKDGFVKEMERKATAWAKTKWTPHLYIIVHRKKIVKFMVF